MSLLQKFKINSYCVGGRHYNGTTGTNVNTRIRSITRARTI